MWPLASCPASLQSWAAARKQLWSLNLISKIQIFDFFSKHLTFFPITVSNGESPYIIIRDLSPSSVAFPNLFLILLILLLLNSIQINSLAFIFFSLLENYNQIVQFIDRPSDYWCHGPAIILDILLGLSICFVIFIPCFGLLLCPYFLLCKRNLLIGVLSFVGFFFFFFRNLYNVSPQNKTWTTVNMTWKYVIWKVRSRGEFVERKIRVQMYHRFQGLYKNLVIMQLDIISDCLARAGRFLKLIDVLTLCLLEGKASICFLKCVAEMHVHNMFQFLINLSAILKHSFILVELACLKL